MGTWGPKLYQDDLAEEIRDTYKDRLHRGKTGEKITQEIIASYGIENDIDDDDVPVFWFALADTQWNLGRLESFVKEKALYYIDEGTNLLRWQNEGTTKDAHIRAKVLSELKEKLQSPQPEMKKISQYRLYRCEWKIGDVFAYQLCSDYAKKTGVKGKYMYFIKVGEEEWWPGHINPEVYFFKTISDKLISINDIKNVDFIPQFFIPNVYRDNPKEKMLYLLLLITTSSKSIPKDRLTYLGNLKQFCRIENENTNSYSVSWKDFEEYIIDNFKNWSVL